MEVVQNRGTPNHPLIDGFSIKDDATIGVISPMTLWKPTWSLAEMLLNGARGRRRPVDPYSQYFLILAIL